MILSSCHRPDQPLNTQEHIRELEYSLAKRVRDMERGFHIQTNYGPIFIGPEYAEAFRNLTADVLQYQLNLLSIETPDTGKTL